jgi:hypothetical protein
MYELYTALPLQPPPDCYIATAAAQGHPQIVGSRVVRRANGDVLRVNKQLQILKCVELACMAVLPRVHKTFRTLYDTIGKPIAQKMRHPFLADVAYLLLKPCEWLARWGLKIIVPDIDSISQKMYLDEKHEPVSQARS